MNTSLFTYAEKNENLGLDESRFPDFVGKSLDGKFQKVWEESKTSSFVADDICKSEGNLVTSPWSVREKLGLHLDFQRKLLLNFHRRSVLDPNELITSIFKQ